MNSLCHDRRPSDPKFQAGDFSMWRKNAGCPRFIPDSPCKRQPLISASYPDHGSHTTFTPHAMQYAQMKFVLPSSLFKTSSTLPFHLPLRALDRNLPMFSRPKPVSWNGREKQRTHKIHIANKLQRSWVKRNQLDATYFIIYSILIQCSTCFGR